MTKNSKQENTTGQTTFVVKKVKRRRSSPTEFTIDTPQKDINRLKVCSHSRFNIFVLLRFYRFGFCTKAIQEVTKTIAYIRRNPLSIKWQTLKILIDIGPSGQCLLSKRLNDCLRTTLLSDRII